MTCVLVRPLDYALWVFYPLFLNPFLFFLCFNVHIFHWRLFEFIFLVFCCVFTCCEAFPMSSTFSSFRMSICILFFFPSKDSDFLLKIYLSFLYLCFALFSVTSKS